MRWPSGNDRLGLPRASQRLAPRGCGKTGSVGEGVAYFEGEWALGSSWR